MTAKRDPSRLMRPTSAFSQKIDLDELNKERFAEGLGRKTASERENFILCNQHRSIPAWRRG